MSAYVYLTTSRKITSDRCKLLSIILTNTGSNEGTVVVYDAHNADANYIVGTFMVSSEDSKQHRWEGLELLRGLYVSIDDKTDMVTVEWDPCGDGSS